ncbi:hypothetical protein [Picosynechococcus sp. NKBG15041c]|uniref:hypothetical protein n=1 Tax=Picosynechococcus sp. NKBG15041c TaxID=1407650 RepID=UPI0003FFF72F|nr:hypothetical protein [Picosynechococcus sp. NKBG15041c]
MAIAPGRSPFCLILKLAHLIAKNFLGKQRYQWQKRPVLIGFGQTYACRFSSMGKTLDFW